jgi:hypothetical protein
VLNTTCEASTEPECQTQVLNPALTQVPNATPEGTTAMTKLVLAAIAALSIIASPVFAGPYDASTTTSYNGDFQLQGR